MGEIVISNGVRYPAEFAKRHGIKADETRTTRGSGERERTTAAVGTVVTDDAAGSVITSAANDTRDNTGVNRGLAAPPVDAALAEAKAAEAAGKGKVGTTGEPDNTGDGTPGNTEGDGGDDTKGEGDGGAAGSDSGSGDSDGAAPKRPASRAGTKAGK